jgi:serine/threonine protein kinase
MPLKLGAHLGPYEIVSALGAGGMGEVYRARDPRLGRDVAVKILPGTFSAGPDRLQRFEQEARAVAGLNHPNILVVHDVRRRRRLRRAIVGPTSALRRGPEFGWQMARVDCRRIVPALAA